MSAQPIPIEKAAELARARRHAEVRADALYVVGASLVTIGIGLMEFKFALIVAGCFCLLPPVLQLASGFLKGIRPIARR